MKPGPRLFIRSRPRGAIRVSDNWTSRRLSGLIDPRYKKFTLEIKQLPRAFSQSLYSKTFLSQVRSDNANEIWLQEIPHLVILSEIPRGDTSGWAA